jgi:hypothetical protein
MRGSHKMVTGRVLVVIRGGKANKGEKGGWGEGKDIVATKFGHHPMALIKFL